MSAPTTIQAIKSIWKKVYGIEGSALSFPDTVAALHALGVVRYQVDWIANTVTSYIRDPAAAFPGSDLIQETVEVVTIPSHDTNISKSFDVQGLKEALRFIQQGRCTYEHFANYCMRAGVSGYITFITGRRVLYFGAEGTQHVEFFPGSQD